jgi:uncharacterized protein YkwD
MLRLTNLVLLVSLSATGLLVGCNSAGVPAVGGYGGAASLPPGDGDTADWLADSSAPAQCIIQPDDEELASQMLSLVNIERARVGVSPLTHSEKLTQAAEEYACVMAAEDFFDHVHPVTGEGPGARAADAGYEFFAVGENLAGGQMTSAEALDGWMNSPSHRTNMLSPEWKESGIGIRRGGSLRIYWVQEFGNPARRMTHAAEGDRAFHDPAGSS